MTTSTTAIPITVRSPFDLPELIHRLSRFVAVKDALSCALVAKSWTDSFISTIWFKVDFDTQSRFANLSPAVVTKHGHYIRIVINAKSLSQVTILANTGVHELRGLQIDPTASVLQYIQAYEIIHRNNTNLEELYLLPATASSNKQESFAHYVSAPALAPSLGGTLPSPSKLKSLRIEDMCVTHDSLAAILQGCPRLSEVAIPNTDVVGIPTQSFQHQGVALFGSSFKSIFEISPTDPSLLSYFPALKTLSTFGYNLVSTISPVKIKEQLTRYCPHLTGYLLEDNTGAIVPDFFIDIVNNVSEICFLYRTISLETITAILLHQSTLKAVKHFLMENSFNFEKEEVVPVLDHFQTSGRFIQLIPRCCPVLEVLDLYGHEMDMDAVEQSRWVCKDLKSLRIRIKGLNTKEKILKAIALWRKGCWRGWQEKAGTLVEKEEQEEQDGTELSIEARVARHLLKFDKLWWVWLGYQTWTPI
ncbi:hypothetical protein BGZ47_007101 [Haplosporangium gracile]|nr:hypothetical protein BGZ47_007101 [Haplosporangium gracile]